jgi:WD40 repeat protein
MRKIAFISCSSKDRSVAEQICQLLEERGIGCWIAPRDVRPGRNFAEEIMTGIESTDVMILILSEHANRSVHVIREVDRAVSKGKPVLPIRIREVQPAKSLELYISSTQWVDAWTPPLEAKVGQLATAIEELAKSEPLEPQEPSQPTPDPTSGIPGAAAFSQDEQTLVGGGDDGVIRIQDTATSQPSAPSEIAEADTDTTLRATDTSVSRQSWFRRFLNSTVRIGRHKAVVATVAGLMLVCIFILVSHRLGWWPWRIERTLVGHTNWVWSVAFSPDGRSLVSGSADGTIRIWDTHTGRLRRIIIGHGGDIYSVAIKQDGDILAGGKLDGAITLWRMATGDAKLTIPGHKTWIRSVAFSPDGKTLASAGLDALVARWDSVNGTLKWSRHTAQGELFSVAFSPDGETLATVGEDSTVKLLNADTGEVERMLTKHKGAVLSVAFSPDGGTIATSSDDGTVILWDASTGEAKLTLAGHKHWVRCVAFSPDGNTLASGSLDDTVMLWDTRTGELRETLSGHTNAGFTVAFSPDGKTLASGSADTSVKLWDVDRKKSERNR